MRDLYGGGGAFMLDEHVPAFLPADVKAWLGGVVADFSSSNGPRIYIGDRLVDRNALHVLAPTEGPQPDRLVRCLFRILMREEPKITGYVHVPWETWQEVRAGSRNALAEWGV
jgi:hypothetical protein